MFAERTYSEPLQFRTQIITENKKDKELENLFSRGKIRTWAR